MSDPTVNLFFETQELPQILLDAVAQDRHTGFWQFQLKNGQGDPAGTWYLNLLQGQIIYSGPRPLSLRNLIKTLQRYVPRLRNVQANQAIQSLIDETPASELELYGKVLHKVEMALAINHQDVVQAIQLQALSDFETYLDCAGFGQFSRAMQSPSQLIRKAPINGFTLESLFSKYQQRQQEWIGLQSTIPSMQAFPKLNHENIAQSRLSEAQKQKLQKLVQPDQSLQAIAELTAKDSLEIAKTFGSLVQRGLVSLQLPKSDGTEAPHVFIVDDSVAFLKQIQTLVTTWGYRVEVWSHPLSAIQQILASNPSVIFLDLNMPGLSGFELIKEIRREPQLSALPLVLLTAENSMSNQWRAKWGNCRFLVKPRSKDEISIFQLELQDLLYGMMPLEAVMPK
jgi:CheY-like chemotaxis protein